MRTMSSRTCVGCGIDAMYCVPLLKFGFGNVPALTSEPHSDQSNRRGMTLPGNGPPGFRPSDGLKRCSFCGIVDDRDNRTFPLGRRVMQICPAVGKFVGQDRVGNGRRAALDQPAPLFIPEEERPSFRFVVDVGNKKRTADVAARFVQLEFGPRLGRLASGSNRWRCRRCCG